MGVLALEMLRECPENTKKLQDDSDHRWYLSFEETPLLNLTDSRVQEASERSD